MSDLRVISGGQTGVDRAALDVALARGVPCGGWCPAGRRAEDGPIPDRYPLKTTSSSDYAERTLANVRDSDATLILQTDTAKSQSDAMSRGTSLTADYAKQYGRPLYTAELATGESNAVHCKFIYDWIGRHEISVLNIAGPRESECPGIYTLARDVIWRVFTMVTQR